MLRLSWQIVKKSLEGKISSLLELKKRIRKYNAEVNFEPLDAFIAKVIIFYTDTNALFCLLPFYFQMAPTERASSGKRCPFCPSSASLYPP